jgi:signal transduction histidine kinase
MANASTAEAWRPESEHDRRVLIVDDDPDFADALAEMLAINDFIPRVVNNADAAVVAAAAFAPALALVDVRLGRVSGLDQIARLRETDPTLICVMITAYADTQIAVEALRVGADDFLRKPLRPEEALGVMYRCLAKRRMAVQAAAMEARIASMQKSDSIARLTSGVAHEFNNLLTVILGNLHFLAEDLEEANGPQGPQRAKWVDAIQRSATHGANLTHQLLSYSRKEPLSARAIDLSDAMTSLRALLDASLGEGIRIGMVLPGGLWSAQADPTGMEEALINLALNARDAMPDGGMVTITLENRTLDRQIDLPDAVLMPGDYVAVAVADTGTGMTEAVRARAFEPFFTTKDTRQGTGLGLSMVHGFAVQSGGGATIASEPGKGTTVTLYLPRAPEALVEDAPATEAARLETAPANPAIANATILVVEDDPDVRLLATTMLNGLGYRCLVADNGARALTLIDGGANIDLMFTDIVMPGGISGHVLWDEAVKRRPDLRVVFTSGNSNQMETEAASDQNHYFLRKPYNIEALRTIIAAALSE